MKKFLQDCAVMVDSPDKADLLFTEEDCWIAIWPAKSNNGDRRARLYISLDATIFARENRAGFIWGGWDDLRSVAEGKKVFDMNVPVARQKPFDNDFLPCNGGAIRFEANRPEGKGLNVPASV